MIPPIMTSVTTMPAPKAKIGFSIESIVGERESSKSPSSRDDSYRLRDYQREISTALRIPHYSPIEVKSPSSPATDLRTFREENNLQTPSPPIRGTEHIHASTGSPGIEHTMHGGGIHRPFPMVPQSYEHSPPPPQPPSQQMTSPFGMQMHQQHLLATQFQMAAALAQQQMQQGFGPGGHMQPPPHLMNSMPRDSYPLYPWLLSRHGRVFPPAVLGNFLLHPFRKPKRVRTAFSPNQLLKLEHAFEANQYVVGAERKALAKSLNLSETQVKVWFQNRRTKHKRMQQEDVEPGKTGSNQSSFRHNDEHSSDEDELIDLEMDDCPSEEDFDSKHR